MWSSTRRAPTKTDFPAPEVARRCRARAAPGPCRGRAMRSRTWDTDIGSGTSGTRPPRQRQAREQARGLAREQRTGPAGAPVVPLRDGLQLASRLEALGDAKRGRVDIYDLARACDAPGPRK